MGEIKQAGGRPDSIDIQQKGRLVRKASANVEIGEILVVVRGSRKPFCKPKYTVGLSWGAFPPKTDVPFSQTGYSERRGKFAEVAKGLGEDERQLNVEDGKISEIFKAVAEKLNDPKLKNGQ